jgi:hypothetical protein
MRRLRCVPDSLIAARPSSAGSVQIQLDRSRARLRDPFAYVNTWWFAHGFHFVLP